MSPIQGSLRSSLLLVFAILLMFWSSTNFNILGLGSQKMLFFDSYWLILIFGVVAGAYASYSWGSFRSVLGRSILSFTIGLSMQLFGQLTFSFLYWSSNGVVPYPSIPDIGFFGSIPLYSYGALQMAKSAGARRALKSLWGLLISVSIPMVMLALTVGVFIYGKSIDLSNWLMTFLDFGYPIGQAIYVVLAILTYLLSSEWLGGRLRMSVVFIVMGLLTQYLADSTFLYQNINAIWEPGSVSDLMYLVAYFFMSYGLLDFWIKYSLLKNSNIEVKRI